MKIEIVHVKGCKGAGEASRLVDQILKETGIQAEVLDIVVETPEDAVRNKHIGSPTVLINGLDVEPDARGVLNFGLG